MHFTPSHERRSISQERTFAQDIADGETIYRTLLGMSEDLAARLRKHRLVAQTVRLKLRYPDFSTGTRQVTLPQPTDQGQVIHQAARALLRANWREGQLLRLLGLAVSGLLESGYQLRLLDQGDQRRIRLNEALDQIRDKFGHDAIVRASLLGDEHDVEEQEGEDV